MVCETMIMKDSLEIDPMSRLLSGCDMRTEPIESIESEQMPILYTTLEEALNAKMAHTKRILTKLKPDAKTRLANETKQGRKGLPAT
jgi:hypothetical protein